MMCGMDEQAAWRSMPGKLLDVFLWRQAYDDQLHGIKRRKDGDD